ncbi:MAG TPA: EAL domain-containing protein [Pyrinomonadaceae bacterium]|nr:EAL domain-containing protein [Pyrinomonadaceae bacterium]
MPKQPNDAESILILDDETHIRRILCEGLVDDYECHTAASAEEALQILATKEFAVVISDITMPGISGLEMVPQILALNPDTVVIMMSGAQTIDTAIDALRVGAFDYLAKPFDLRQVEAVVRRALDHRSLRLAKRQYETQLEQMVEQRTADLMRTTKALQDEIVERNKAEEKINYLAYYDALTSLPNRALFRDRLEQALSTTHRDENNLAVVFLSPDRIKKINSTFGRSIAEKLVCSVSEKLRISLREADTLAYGGRDEFAIILPQLRGTEEAVEIVRRLQATLEPHFKIDKHEFYLTSSIGIGIYPHDGSNAETLMKNAGAALERAREQGGNNYQFYTADLNAKALKHLAMENDLRRALERDELFLCYQPKVDTNTWEILGVEALIRWQHPTLGCVSPADFIPLAEDTGLIVPIGEWTLKIGCAQLKAWHEMGFALSLAVNLSPRQFEQDNLLEMVIDTLNDTGLDPNCLELEVTEGSLMTNSAVAAKALGQLRDLGVKVSIDDFGTGFSSLGYLKRLPIDCLKIDKSFVSDATTNPDDASLVMAIITLAHNLRLKVIAEGVETREQLRFLHLLRCDQIQGFLFSKPLPAAEFEELLGRGKYPLRPWEELRSEPHARFERGHLVSAA